jgi:hypothetical protein
MTGPIEARKLVGKWRHSHEEDTAGTMVFRPASHRFPPSRGRRGFELRADGTMVDQAIAPDDRSAAQEGSWQLTDHNKLQMQPSGASGSTMELVEAAPDKLVFRK